MGHLLRPIENHRFKSILSIRIIVAHPISGYLNGAFGSEIAPDRSLDLLAQMTKGHLFVSSVLRSVVDLSSRRIP